MALNGEKKKFAKWYAKSRDHIESYLKVFPKCDRKTAATNGKRWLKNAEISAEIARLSSNDDEIHQIQQEYDHVRHVNDGLVTSSDELDSKEKRFCLEFIIDLNASRAAIRAGYSARSAGSIGYELLKKPQVQATIRKLQEDRAQRTQVTADRVIEELASIAFAKITDFINIKTEERRQTKSGIGFKNDGTEESGEMTEEKAFPAEETTYYKVVDIVDTNLMPEKFLRALQYVKEGRNGIEIKTHDKVKALELIGRHLSMWRDNINLNNEALEALYKNVMGNG